MNKTAGLAAAAAAAVGGGVGNAYAALPSGCLAAGAIGCIAVQLSASSAGNDPTIYIYNTSGSSFTAVKIKGTYDSGAAHATSPAAGLIIAPGKNATFEFATGIGQPFDMPASNVATATFQVVGNGIYSQPFGSDANVNKDSINWLGFKDGVVFTSSISVGMKVVADIYAYDVPEPATVLMLGAGLLGLGAARRRRA